MVHFSTVRSEMNRAADAHRHCRPLGHLFIPVLALTVSRPCALPWDLKGIRARVLPPQAHSLAGEVGMCRNTTTNRCYTRVCLYPKPVIWAQWWDAVSQELRNKSWKESMGLSGEKDNSEAMSSCPKELVGGPSAGEVGWVVLSKGISETELEKALGPGLGRLAGWHLPAGPGRGDEATQPTGETGLFIQQD